VSLRRLTSNEQAKHELRDQCLNYEGGYHLICAAGPLLGKWDWTGPGLDPFSLFYSTCSNILVLKLLSIMRFTDNTKQSTFVQTARGRRNATYSLTPVFPNLFYLLPKIAHRRWVITPHPNHAQTLFFHRNAHLFLLHTQLTRHKWQTIIINF